MLPNFVKSHKGAILVALVGHFENMCCWFFCKYRQVFLQMTVDGAIKSNRAGKIEERVSGARRKLMSSCKKL